MRRLGIFSTRNTRRNLEKTTKSGIILHDHFWSGGFFSPANLWVLSSSGVSSVEVSYTVFSTPCVVSVLMSSPSGFSSYSLSLSSSSVNTILSSPAVFPQYDLSPGNLNFQTFVGTSEISLLFFPNSPVVHTGLSSSTLSTEYNVDSSDIFLDTNISNTFLHAHYSLLPSSLISETDKSSPILFPLFFFSSSSISVLSLVHGGELSTEYNISAASSSSAIATGSPTFLYFLDASSTEVPTSFSYSGLSHFYSFIGTDILGITLIGSSTVVFPRKIVLPSYVDVYFSASVSLTQEMTINVSLGGNSDDRF